MEEIALFPIPQCVCFPKTVFPLHVFEPRYRALIKDAVREQRKIAICEVEKTITDAKANQSLAETLNSNQANYQPKEIFSAGFAEITDITADGRIFAEVKMDARYQLIEETQSVPYRVAKCKLVEDDEVEITDELENQRQKLEQILIDMAEQNNPKLKDYLCKQEWINQSFEDFTFAIFQFIRFDAPEMQRILEMPDPIERFESIYQVFQPSN